MDTLIKSLPTIIKAAGNEPQVIQAAAIAAWNHAAGEGLRNHAQPIALSGQTMVVGVPDSPWQKQLSSLKAELLFRINNLLGGAFVTDIELRIDSGLRQNKIEDPKRRGIVTEDDVSPELWAAADAIEDKELSKKFLRAAIAAIRASEGRNR